MPSYIVPRRIAVLLAGCALSLSLAACGGASEAPVSTAAGFTASGTTAGSTTVSGAAEQPTLITLDQLPYVDPAPLSAMLAEPESQFAARLANDWPSVEQLLHNYIPANVDFAWPTPMSFTGPWSSCMTQHGSVACREHMTQLVGLMNGKPH